MVEQNHPSRLGPTLCGMFLGVCGGGAAAFLLTIWTFQGVGAAQGFADDPNWVPFTLLFFGFICLPIGGSVGGLLGHRAAGVDPTSGPKTFDPMDKLA